MVQKLAWGYAGLFVFVVLLGYLPGVNDAQGLMFGLFKLDLYDDLLHLASGIWAGIAAWCSARAAIFYFKTFGILYGFDGIVGLITERGYLDLGIFLNDKVGLDLSTRIAANLPHIFIGGVAAYVGFVLSRKLAEHS